MGWGNSFFPLLIVTSSTGFTGLFVYSPGVGSGNLIISNASHAGTDPYGNAFLQGVTTYLNVGGGVFLAVNIVGSHVNFAHSSTGAGGPYTFDQQMVSSGAGTVPILATQALQLIGNLDIKNNLLVEIQTYSPGFTAVVSGAIETVHTITAGFPAGWSGTISYWRSPDGVTPQTIMDFHLTIANGTVVTNNEALGVSVAAGYFYATDNKFIGGQVNGAGAPAGSSWAPMRIDNAGGLHYDGPGFTAGVGGAFHYSAGSSYPTTI